MGKIVGYLSLDSPAAKGAECYDFVTIAALRAKRNLKAERLNLHSAIGFYHEGHEAHEDRENQMARSTERTRTKRFQSRLVFSFVVQNPFSG